MSRPHTPPPWKILYAAQDEMTEAECIAEEMPVVSVGPIDYAEFANAGTEEERANARLIAAAPDLLEAAREVWEARKEIFANGTDVAPWTPLGFALLGLNKAIAKAEGSK
jgi:hypothetical protein